MIPQPPAGVPGALDSRWRSSDAMGGSYPRRTRGVAPITALFLMGIALVSMYNALGPRELPGQREGYAALVGVVGVGLLLRARDVRLDRDLRRISLLWVFFLTVGLIGILNQVIVYPLYIAGDAASVAFPLLILLAGCAEFGLLRSRRTHAWIAVILLAAALLAINFPDRSGRFEPPSNFLLALLTVYGLLGMRGGRRAAAVGIIALVFVVGFMSEVRTAPILALASLAATAVVAGTNPKAYLAVGLVLVTILVASQSSRIVRETEAFLLETRFKRIVAGEVDESLLTRLLEAEDVVWTAEREWSAGNIVVGSGHGATYQPHQSLVERNLTRDGRVHNIHIGPALTGFRYGVLGLLVLGFGVIIVARSMSLLYRNMSSAPQAYMLHAVFTVAMVLYLLDFLLRNVLTDPLFSYALAGFLITRRDAFQQRGPPGPEQGVDETA